MSEGTIMRAAPYGVDWMAFSGARSIVGVAATQQEASRRADEALHFLRLIEKANQRRQG